MQSAFTEEINKIALSSNDDKRIQSIASIETYAYGSSKDLVCNKEQIKCSNIKKQCKMINFEYITKENKLTRTTQIHTDFWLWI